MSTPSDLRNALVSLGYRRDRTIPDEPLEDGRVARFYTAHITEGRHAGAVRTVPVPSLEELDP